MKIGISIFFILILLFLTSKLKINIKCIKNHKNSLKVKFDVKFELFLIGIVKITLFSVKPDGIHFLFFVISYNKLKFDKESMKIIKEVSVLDIVKGLHIRLEKLKLHADIGIENPALTAFLVTFIASSLSIFLARNQKQMKTKQFFYQINPVYNTNILEFDTTAKISLKTWDLLKVILLLNKNKKQKNIAVKPNFAKI